MASSLPNFQKKGDGTDLGEWMQKQIVNSTDRFSSYNVHSGKAGVDVYSSFQFPDVTGFELGFLDETEYFIKSVLIY